MPLLINIHEVGFAQRSCRERTENFEGLHCHLGKGKAMAEKGNSRPRCETYDRLFFIIFDSQGEAVSCQCIKGSLGEIGTRVSVKEKMDVTSPWITTHIFSFGRNRSRHLVDHSQCPQLITIIQKDPMKKRHRSRLNPTVTRQPSTL